MCIARYLYCAPQFRIFYSADISKGLEVYANADFASTWAKKHLLIIIVFYLDPDLLFYSLNVPYSDIVNSKKKLP